MSAIEDEARAVAEAVMNHARILVTGSPDGEAARAGAEVDQAARRYAKVVEAQYGWSSPFPQIDVDDDVDDDDEVLTDAGFARSVVAMDITAVVVSATPAADSSEVARDLLHGLERYFDEYLPAGYRASEVGVFPRPGHGPAVPGRAGRAPD